MKNSFLIEHKKAPLRKRNVLLIILFVCLLFGAIFQNDIKSVMADTNLWSLVKGQSGQGLNEVGQQVYGSPDPKQDIRGIIAKVLEVFLGFLALIFIVLLILAGVKWMLARGDEAKVTEASHQILHAVIGLAIILAAYAITYYVFNTLNNNVMDYGYF